MLLSRLDRFNQRHPWSHNDHYGPWVVEQVAASRARHVLDVGCGAGNLVARLREEVTTMTALEPDPAMVSIAKQRFVGDPAVTVVHTDFAGRDPGRRWDAVVLVAVLHHLPLVPTLRELRECLAPGGRLVVVGCYRAAGLIDLLADLPSIAANPVMGLIKHPARASGHRRTWQHRPLIRTRPRPTSGPLLKLSCLVPAFGVTCSGDTPWSTTLPAPVASIPQTSAELHAWPTFTTLFRVIEYPCTRSPSD